jgi:hypothetical protein
VRIITTALDANVSRDAVLSFLADARHIPQWAPDFADSVRQRTDATWRITKDGQQFDLRVEIRILAGTVDYLREIAPGTDAGAYMRVLPRPGGGSVIVMTQIIDSAEDLDVTAKTLRRALTSLVAHLSS